MISWNFEILNLEKRYLVDFQSWMSTKHEIYFTCFCICFRHFFIYYLYIMQDYFPSQNYFLPTYFNKVIIAKHCCKICIPAASLFHFNDPTVAVLNKNLRTLRIKEILLRTTLLRVYWFYDGPDYGNSRDKGPHHKKKKNNKGKMWRARRCLRTERINERVIFKPLRICNVFFITAIPHNRKEKYTSGIGKMRILHPILKYERIISRNGARFYRAS